MNTFGGGMATGKMMRNPTGVGGTDLALNVYHGTPHEIKGGFNLAKVGTGEGAQSYGHGIYFAQNPIVAEEYKKILSSKIDVNGKPLYRNNNIVGSTGNKELDDYLIANIGDVKATKKQLLGDIKEIRTGNPQAAKEMQQTLVELRKANVNTTSSGNLYKADIPDVAIPMMLDYDSPIKSQPQLYELVRQSITDPDLRKTFETNAESGISGANVYKNYISGKTDAERSANAAKLGITGIRYLDQNSRVPSKYTGDSAYTFAGQSFKESGFTLDDAFAGMKKAYKNANEKELKDALGVVYGEMPNKTSNFVVFKPETVEILERNGVPTRKELLQQEFDKLDK